MARANLGVAEELRASFTAAQEDTSTRWLKVGIDGETILQTGAGQVGGATGADFDALVDAVDLAEATFVLFCVDEECAAQASRQWLLVAWVPDLCKVRDKMMYSSSREDLKRTLGAGLFVGDYFASEAADLDWRAYQRTLDVTAVPLSEKERLMKEETLLERDTAIKSSAMGFIPFHLTAEAQASVERFVSAADGPNVVELRLGANEEVELASAHALDAEAIQHVGGLISPAEPRFVVVRMGAGEPGGAEQPSTFFVYSCPDDSPLRMKMTYSTAKATVIGAAAGMGLTIDKVVEVTDPGADLDGALAAEVSTASQGEGEAAALTHTANAQKPKRPGRGRARPQKKFNPDA